MLASGMGTPDPEQLVGEVAYVTTRIRGPNQPGEVQVVHGRGSETFIAYGDEALERGQRVLIVARRPGRAVDVIFFAG